MGLLKTLNAKKEFLEKGSIRVFLQIFSLKLHV